MPDRSYGTIPFQVEGDVVKFLLVFENWGEGHWNFPKGHAEVGETPLETALRELKEETGLEPEVIVSNSPLIHEYSFIYEGREIERRLEYWLVLVEEDPKVLQEDELRDFAWMTLDEVLEATPYPELKNLARRAHKLALAYKMRGE